MHVVAVDDDPDVLQIVTMTIDDRHHVQGFTGAADAIAGADWPRTDVLVADVMMPGMAGDELLSWCAEHHPHVRRVILTAIPIGELDAERFGLAHDIVSKPFSAETLMGGISNG